MLCSFRVLSHAHSLSSRYAQLRWRNMLHWNDTDRSFSFSFQAPSSCWLARANPASRNKGTPMVHMIKVPPTPSWASHHRGAVLASDQAEDIRRLVVCCFCLYDDDQSSSHNDDDWRSSRVQRTWSVLLASPSSHGRISGSLHWIERTEAPRGKPRRRRHSGQRGSSSRALTQEASPASSILDWFH